MAWQARQARQARRGKQQIPQRQGAGEVLVDAFSIRRVVPVVQGRRPDQPAQHRKLPAHGGLDERGVERHEHETGLQRHWRHAEDEHRQERGARVTITSTTLMREPTSQSIQRLESWMEWKFHGHGP